MFLHSSAMEGEEKRAVLGSEGERHQQRVRDRNGRWEKIQVERNYFRKYREHWEENI